MNRFCLLICVVVWCSCGSSAEKALLEDSIKEHEAALRAASGAQSKIEQLQAMVSKSPDSLQLIYRDSLMMLKIVYQKWQESIVEVPGHDDHHDHDHGHDHHGHAHEAAPDLTPEMVLNIQKEMKHSALKLDKRTQQMIDDFKLLRTE